jgi:TolA-binding protein
MAALHAQNPPPAQGGGDLDAVYTEGMAAFGKGDYPKAISDLETILAKAGEGAQLETVYYTLGAAYFNAGDYAKAVNALETYLKKYPQSQKRAETTFSLGLAALQAKDFAKAIAAFKSLEGDPAYAERALLNEANALRDSGKPDDAIQVLNKLLAQGVHSSETANGAMQLATIYAQKKQGEKAVEVMRKIRAATSMLDNVVRLNALAIELGDGFLKNSQPDQALACYRLVQSKPEVLRLQQARIDALQKKLDANLAAMRADPTKAPGLAPENEQIRQAIAETRKMAEEFEKQPAFEPALWLRWARALSEAGKKWEALAVYDELLRKYPQEQREATLYGLVIASADAGRNAEKTRALCDLFLKEFPNSPSAGTIAYLSGATALQANDPAAAESFFGHRLDVDPHGQYAEEMRFLLGNARFSQGKYDDARKDYEIYVKDYPQGSHVEECVYRMALAQLFSGQYEAAWHSLDDYLKKYPSGGFRADAKYRIAVCKYAASLYPEVIVDCQAWEKQFPGDTMLGEVLALEGDALAAQGENAKATDVYIRAWKLAGTDEVLNYALGEAQKLLQKAGDWDRMTAMFDEFVQTHPTNPTAVAAVYWISKAKVRQGKVDEAKKYVADTIRKYIDDPSRDAVEQLLGQLAQLSLRKQPGETAPADPMAEFDRLLGAADAKTPLAKARILYAKAEFAKLKKHPDDEAKNLQAIADQFSPDDLSAPILARVGDYLLAKGDLDKAETFFNRLMDGYASSDFVEYAYNGLGEIAYQRKQYDKALGYFNDAIDKIGASMKLKDVTVGKAKTLLAMGRLDEAKKIFEQVASTREWRGEATAFSVYSLGQIEQKKSRFAEANAYYQRVFVAYQKFLPWVAKAYLGSAECFVKLGKTPEAVRTLQEMLRNQSLSSFPEYQEARKRLTELGQG